MAVATIAVVVGAVSPAAAISDSGSSHLPNTGAIIQANAWNCNLYNDKCDFSTSAKALNGGSAYAVDRIVNTATITANGWNVTLSTAPAAQYVNERTRRTTWTNYNSWISDLHGIADPSGAFNTSITTCSDASGFHRGVKAFASACT